MTSSLMLRLPSPIQISSSSGILAVPTKSGCRVATTSMGCSKKSLKFFSEKTEAKYFKEAFMPNKMTSRTCNLQQRVNFCFREIKEKIRSEHCASATFQSGTTRVKTLANLAAAKIFVAWHSQWRSMLASARNALTITKESWAVPVRRNWIDLNTCVTTASLFLA